jgi:hypothetical protein
MGLKVESTKGAAGERKDEMKPTNYPKSRARRLAAQKLAARGEGRTGQAQSFLV